MSTQASFSSQRASAPAPAHLRVLLIPDSIHWITGTIAKAFVAHNPWLDGTIISGPVLDIIARDTPELLESFDVVHFVCPYASRSWLPRLRDRIAVVTSHHHVSDDWSTQRHNLNGDAIVAGSSQWAADAVQRGAAPERVISVPYGVDASRFLPATSVQVTESRASLGIPRNAIVVGFFAKLSSNELDRKGTDIFALAVQALARKDPRLVALIIGPGWDVLVAQLRESDVTVVWIPFVRDVAQMPRMYHALDFYWIAARVEGGPVTLLEAMSAGICCVTTPVGLVRDIVEDGVNASVVPFDDASAFVDRTLALIAAPDARASMGARARQTILDTMDVPVTARGIQRAYDVALTHFRSRTPAPVVSRVPQRGSLGKPLLDRVALLEQLVWAEALMLQGQRTLALRLMAETWARHPLSSVPLRFLFRNLLPPRLVKALVRVKAGVAGSS